MTQESIVTALTEKSNELFIKKSSTATFKLKTLFLYGSRNNNSHRNNSDIDAMIVAQDTPDQKTIVYHGKLRIQDQLIPCEFRIFSENSLIHDIDVGPAFIAMIVRDSSDLCSSKLGLQIKEKANQRIQKEYEAIIRSLSAEDFENSEKVQSYFLSEAYSSVSHKLEKSSYASALERLYSTVRSFYALNLRRQAAKLSESQLKNDSKLLNELLFSSQAQLFRLLDSVKYEFQPWYIELLESLNQVTSSLHGDNWREPLLSCFQLMDEEYHKNTGGRLLHLSSADLPESTTIE